MKAQNGRRDADPRETAKSGGVLLAPPMRPHPCQHGGLLIDQSASGERRLLAKRPCHEEIENKGQKQVRPCSALFLDVLLLLFPKPMAAEERERHTQKENETTVKINENCQKQLERTK